MHCMYKVYVHDDVLANTHVRSHIYTFNMPEIIYGENTKLDRVYGKAVV